MWVMVLDGTLLSKVPQNKKKNKLNITQYNTVLICTLENRLDV